MKGDCFSENNENIFTKEYLKIEAKEIEINQIILMVELMISYLTSFGL